MRNIHRLKKNSGADHRKSRMEHWQIITAYLMIYDFFAVEASYFFALWIRFDCRFQMIPKEYLNPYFHTIFLYAIFCILIFWMMRLYKSIWRFASYSELTHMIFATVITLACHIAAVTGLVKRMPVSYYLFGIMMQFILTLGARFAYRFAIFLS